MVFTTVLTVTGITTFFVSAFSEANSAAAYSIASIYILCMLLAVPSLKAFMDKIECPTMKRLNVLFITIAFVAIMVLMVTSALTLAFPSIVCC